MHPAKLLIATAMATSVFALTPSDAHAQARVGAGVAFGTESALGLALQANGYYGIDSVLPGLRVGGAFTYYFADDPLTYWTIDLNGQYRFSKPGPFGIYVIGGLDIGHWSIDEEFLGVQIEASETDIGLNFGMGVEYAIQPTFELFGELTYVLVADYDRAVVALGGRFLF